MSQRLPAASGLQWIRDGFVLLRRQPRELTLTFLVYVTINLVLSAVVPPLGPIALLLANQALITAFMRACAEADSGRKVHPSVLFCYFRGPTMGRLARLGLCYLAASLISSSAMYFYGGDVLTVLAQKTQSGVIEPLDPAQSAMVVRTFFLGVFLYAIMVLPLWFAGPLIAWQDMGVAKAIFFSFFSVLRAIKAFIAYVLALAAIVLFMVINMAALASLLSGLNPLFMLLVTIPLSLFLSLTYFCTFYPSYVELFGKPALVPQG